MFGIIRRFLSWGPSERSCQQVLRSFQHQQQELQKEFFAHAAATGKPRGLRWKNCEWLSTFALVEDTTQNLFTMFCGVNVSFEAIEGGDMENVDAVCTMREGSALFHLQNGRWGSGGRILFNMNPSTAAKTAAPDQQLRAVSHE
ncbi:MAG: hypothetical protein GY903_19460 [Fuerstiella sp.]|nr:hypothetical protein [Fuerstiella sp.]MCP4856664.1 hypothetical protein [Fuerstiella sp.]